MQSIKLHISVLAVIGLLLLIGNYANCQNYSQRISIIGNSVDKKTYSQQEIRSILKGRNTNWRNGNRVQIILPLVESESAEYMSREIYGKSVNGVKKYWLGLVFQGRANAPTFVQDNEEVLQLVKKNKGAIGILVDEKKAIPSQFIVDISKTGE